VSDRNIDCWVVNMMLCFRLVYYNGHSNENGKYYVQKWFLPPQKKMQYTDIHLQCGPHHILHTSSNVPLRHKFLRRNIFWLLCQPVMHCLLYCLIWSKVMSKYSIFEGPREVKIAGCQMWWTWQTG
jgi:hypothetical protein